MNTYKYETTDNRTAFSPVPLDYALTATKQLELKQLKAKDSNALCLIANENLAALLSAAGAPTNSCQASVSSTADLSWESYNYCVLEGNEFCLWEDGQYVALSSYMKEASFSDQKQMLSKIAAQAAICRDELLRVKPDYGIIMTTYRYNTTADRTVLSPIPLAHALVASQFLRLTQVSEKEESLLNVFPNDGIAEIAAGAIKPKDCKNLNELETPFDMNWRSWISHHKFVLIDGTIFIHQGEVYKPLSTYMQDGDIHLLWVLLSHAIQQAILCRAELIVSKNALVAA